MQETVMGMVLSATPMGEYDKRLVILTREHGKISAFSKGARRPHSPLLACSQPFTFGEFTVYRGKNSYTVSSAKVKNYFTEMREDLDDIYYGTYFCEIAAYCAKENNDESQLLMLLYQSLRALKIPSIPRKLVRLIFELKTMAVNGEAPRVFTCIDCGKTDDLTVFFSREAGIRCKECAGNKKGIEISETTAYTMQRIISSPIEKLYSFTVSDGIVDELMQVMTEYLREYMNVPFHSLEMID